MLICIVKLCIKNTAFSNGMEWNGIVLYRVRKVNNVESISLPIRKLFEKTEHYSYERTRVTIELSKLVHIYVGSLANARFSGCIGMKRNMLRLCMNGYYVQDKFVGLTKGKF